MCIFKGAKKKGKEKRNKRNSGPIAFLGTLFELVSLQCGHCIRTSSNLSRAMHIVERERVCEII